MIIIYEHYGYNYEHTMVIWTLNTIYMITVHVACAGIQTMKQGSMLELNQSQ